MPHPRLRVLLFLVCAVSILLVFDMFYQGLNALNRLDYVERERDRWQRAPEILRELKVMKGSTVVDLGSGSGYFALKLTSEVGSRGRVIAVDIRRLPLTFLWVRSFLRGASNISIVNGDANNPRLPTTVDAVLIVNTYHELIQPQAILNAVRRSLVADGRLVIADRGQFAHSEAPSDAQRQRHELASALVAQDLERAGFRIIRCEDRFAEQPGEGWWWLIVARNG
jgi:ubiquinone/menaquinone biosynthesis C-methylase UbiE